MIIMQITQNIPWQRTVSLLVLAKLHTWVKKIQATTQQVLQAQEDDVGGRGLICAASFTL